MIIKTRFTKSIIENEEGMNHLWIQLPPSGQVEDVRLHVSLPPGIHRLHNQTGYEENDIQEMIIPNPQIENNIVLELFTRDSIKCGERSIIVSVTYKEDSKHTRIEHDVALRVESEEGLDSLIIDEEAVEFIKQLTQQQHTGEQQEFMDYSQSKIIRIESNIYSDLEKKYRIEGNTSQGQLR
jgi:hypothetical protein